MVDATSYPGIGHRTLLERHRELEGLDSALSDLGDATGGIAGGRQGGLLAFTGPAGLGKTTLLAEARLRAVAGGCTVLSAQGGENERGVAFRVVRRLLQPVLAAMDEQERRELLGSWYDIVAAALGIEAEDAAHVPDPTGVRDGLDWVLTRLAVRRAPLVLLLDDLHWADEESLSWLASFAPRADDLPLLIVVAYRPGELPPTAAAFRSLAERHGHRPYSLAPLTADAVARILRDQLGEQTEDAFCDECWAVTGGSPFETVELAVRLGERGVKGTGSDVTLLSELAPAVKGPGLAERLSRLGAPTIRFAWAAAVLGTSIPQELAAAVAGIGSEQAKEATEKLRDARILAEAQGRGARLEFAHPLIATAVYRAIPPGPRAGLHSAAAEAIRTAGLGAVTAARHLLEVPCEGSAETVACLREAARAYLRAGAPEAARRVLTRALREPPAPQDRAALLYELAGSTFLIEPAATVGYLRAALAEPVVPDDLRASLVYRLTQALAHTDRVAEAASVAEQEARLASHPRTRLRMLADHFQWSSCRTDEPDPSGRSRRLARLAGGLTGRGPEERYILGLRAWDALLRGEPRQTVLTHAEEALRGGLSWTDENRGFEVPVSVALTFMYCDQPRRAEELFTRGIAECEAKGWRGSHLALGQTLFGYIRYHRGGLAEAEELVREGLRIADRVDEAVPAQWFAVGILIQILLARGRTAEARRLADAHGYGTAVPNAVIYPDPRTVYAELLLAEGRHGEAAHLLLAVGEWLESRAWHNPAWCPWRLDLAQALAPTAPERAARLAREAVERARDFGAPSAVGQALRTQAETSAGAAALEAYAEAVAQLERSPASYELARALIGQGAALFRNGQPHEAADRLYRGLEGAVHCGADGLVARARKELATAGLRPLPLRYAHTDTLTAQERRAAEMTAQSQPMAVVAEELRLTEQGVRQLLSSAYRKIGTDATGLAGALESFPRPRLSGARE
ncbi:ATP-binding protein [Streptomyces sp. NPDC052040]|uniref:ATP-binding protein n=1 Tax=Streptomyces sp. NPDC052040 TaxID=3365682 RepID=UPI0037CEA16B